MVTGTYLLYANDLAKRVVNDHPCDSSLQCMGAGSLRQDQQDLDAPHEHLPLVAAGRPVRSALSVAADVYASKRQQESASARSRGEEEGYRGRRGDKRAREAEHRGEVDAKEGAGEDDQGKEGQIGLLYSVYNTQEERRSSLLSTPISITRLVTGKLLPLTNSRLFHSVLISANRCTTTRDYQVRPHLSSS